MRNRVQKLILLLLLAGGAALFLYPRLSGYLEHIHQAQVIEQYRQAGRSITDMEYEEMRRAAEDYNRRLAQQPDFDHAAAVARSQYKEEYDQLLDMGDNGVMGSISIPKIGVELPLYHGTEEKELAKGVGHCEGSSLPVGGESTHTVLSGHRGLPSADLFTRLDEVEEGDLFIINTLGRDITYRVDQIKTVLPDETEELSVVPGKDYATLVTCTPYGINTHRLLIRGERTENIPEEERRSLERDTEKENHSFENLMIGIGIVLLIAGTAIWSLRKPGKRKKIERGDKG